MPAKISVVKLVKKNKKVNISKLNSGRKLLKRMRKLGGSRRTYNLASPYSRKAYLETAQTVTVL
jgi:hypothetical protein